MWQLAGDGGRRETSSCRRKRLRNLNIYTSLISMHNRRQISILFENTFKIRIKVGDDILYQVSSLLYQNMMILMAENRNMSYQIVYAAFRLREQKNRNGEVINNVTNVEENKSKN
ncbi:unnamed protein product [Acanthoscelides obtectus]|uniref:Uncharacterized protein n=1 Tax=Acanthoscelides obtectus TaxID=200917 RepID=A0A9P0K2F4_ACAOB|nr:unnamed protein product [Acanthoscelides obtectus]CAK1648059.1 hypothetical protein AOBTE_LOCUS15525 [Acanthoscelides obtectus]